MDSILEFIFKNAFIFIILAGAITSIFNKTKQADKGKKKRRYIPAPDPFFGSNQTLSQEKGNKQTFHHVPPENTKDYMEPVASESPIPIKPPSNYVYHDSSLEYQIELERHENSLARKLTAAKEKSKNMSKQQLSLENNGQTFNFEIDQKQIINGLIMSEVLGKPRALRPYQKR